MQNKVKKELREYLGQFITPKRAESIRQVLKNRTRHVTYMLEDIYQSHNASAVLRSCEINGILDIHVIENYNVFSPNKEVTMGASKWLNLYQYNREENNTLNCINALKQKGYRIVATTPHTDQTNLEEQPLNSPFALLFGTELTGLSQTALDACDEFVRIPMHGFTESYNISVSAALSAYSVISRLHGLDIQWQLSQQEMLEQEIEYYRRSIKNAELLEKKFYEQKNQTLNR